ncbi:hypothetical protein ACFC5Z_12575 [Streptomyces sp. NPDC056004]|uniref:hypothetical protein n=1 Tax=Streptomyces sp. NPDC056004 TaxID=3345677 RepID=UPI0035DEBF55
MPELDGEDPTVFRWDTLPPDVFFELDREEREVKLSKEYRQVFNGGRRGGLNDARQLPPGGNSSQAPGVRLGAINLPLASRKSAE